MRLALHVLPLPDGAASQTLWSHLFPGSHSGESFVSRPPRRSWMEAIGAVQSAMQSAVPYAYPSSCWGWSVITVQQEELRKGCGSANHLPPKLTLVHPHQQPLFVLGDLHVWAGWQPVCKDPTAQCSWPTKRKKLSQSHSCTVALAIHLQHPCVVSHPCPSLFALHSKPHHLNPVNPTC